MLKWTGALVVLGLLAGCSDAWLPVEPPDDPLSSSQVTSTAELTQSRPAVHTLVEDFAGPVIDQQKWSYYHDPARTGQDDRLVVSLTPNVAGYGGLISRLPHGFSASSLTAEISQVAAGGPFTETFIGVVTLDEEEYVVISSLGGKIGAYYKGRGKNWYRLGKEITFDPVKHRFRRLREHEGVVHYELSENGTAWTQPRGWQVAHTFTDLQQLHAAIGAGAYLPDASAGSAVFENVNTTVPAIPRELVATSSPIPRSSFPGMITQSTKPVFASSVG